ncbi:MAG: c-type cytochrome, partial [Limisphaerales bacterium]
QWMRAAVLSSLASGAGEMFTILTANQKIVDDPNGRLFLGELARMIGAQNQSPNVNLVAGFLEKTTDATLAFSLVRSVGEGLERAKSSLVNFPQGSLNRLTGKATEALLEASTPSNTKIEAIKLLAVMPQDHSGLLISLLAPSQSQEIQLATIAALGRFHQASVAEQVVQRWGNFTPRVRSEAITMLLGRPERANVLITAIQRGAIARNELNSTQEKFLKTHRDAGVKAKANAVLVEMASKRQDVIDSFMSSIQLAGNLENGKVIYNERCSACHTFGNQGFALGPDLLTVQNTGKEKLLLNILDPNSEVAPQYQAYEVETNDGESLIGLIVDETANNVTVRQAYGKEDVVARSNIRKMQSQQQSLMPEGLEAGLSPEQMADLLEYISAAKVNE